MMAEKRPYLTLELHIYICDTELLFCSVQQGVQKNTPTLRLILVKFFLCEQPNR